MSGYMGSYIARRASEAIPSLLMASLIQLASSMLMRDPFAACIAEVSPEMTTGDESI